ncbi:hypothetical protein SprV_0200829100 [Sparganum proliferum]
MKDLVNMRRRVFRCDPTVKGMKNALYSMRDGCYPDFLYDDDDDGKLRAACFTTPALQAMYSQYPDVVQMDATYRTNRQGCALYHIVEINDSQYDMEDSNDTLPSREPMRVERVIKLLSTDPYLTEWHEKMPTDRLANLDRAVALLIQHNARLSKKLDVILDSNRRLHGRLRELEAKATCARGYTAATKPNQKAYADGSGLPPAKRAIGRHEIKKSTCGNNLDDFVKRIFFALFEDEISLHINFKGRKLKDSLSNSAVCKVILGVFAAMNKNGAAKMSDLESAFTKRLKRSLDNYVQRQQKEVSNINWTERGSAIDEAIYLLGGEGISSPEPQEDVNDSFETIPLGDEIPATVPKVDGNDDILLLMCKHMRELSMKMDILMESNRKIHGRLRFVESMVQQHAKAAGQTTSQLPLNPIEHQLRSGSEFRNLNVQLLDPGFRKQLTSYLTCLGGHSLDEFVKRIFFAIFEDEISLHVNIRGRRTKERLSGSKLYEVILEVFAAWNTDASIKLSDLEAAITKRLKRSLDSYVQRKNKSKINREESDNTPGPSTDCRPPSTQ